MKRWRQSSPFLNLRNYQHIQQCLIIAAVLFFFYYSFLSYVVFYLKQGANILFTDNGYVKLGKTAFILGFYRRRWSSWRVLNFHAMIQCVKNQLKSLRSYVPNDCVNSVVLLTNWHIMFLHLLWHYSFKKS